MAAFVVVAVSAVAAIGAAPAAVHASSVHPGVQTFTAGAQCTANFIFRDAANTYVGQAAHCSGTGAQTETNGCTAGVLPLGAAVVVTGAAKPGTLVYSSWVTMQTVKETDPNACAFNDFALVRLDASDAGRVDPSVPGIGGPSGVGGAATGAPVFSFGDSSLRLGVAALRPKQGLVVQVSGAGWSRTVLTLTPGIPGDSGSGFLNASGQAIGVLSTLALAPLPLSNGVGDLSRELTYMRAHSAFGGVQLVNGTTPFRPDLLGAIVRGLDAGSDRAGVSPATPPAAGSPTTATPAKSRASRASRACRKRARGRHAKRRSPRRTSTRRSGRAARARIKSSCTRRTRKSR